MNYKEFERKLEEMEVPDPPLSADKERLKGEIHLKYFRESSKVFFAFKPAAIFSFILSLLLTLTVVRPETAMKANRFLGLNHRDNCLEDTNLDKLLNTLDYTSINNPRLKSSLDPSEFSEEKAYIIRQYRSKENGSVMIVSEFKSQTEENFIPVTSESY
ncbi:MAG: hypothetical protein CSB55_02880 [Candidatus Cloacimonadota bacterium]|nr:MAG: hypothetical protein CSB55_02880 [Candidatus Cloacimonadota bacterium]